METNEQNIQRLEKLLACKSFEALSVEEKQFVLEELGSEEQFMLMRKIGLALVNEKSDLSPDPSVLISLKARMEAQRVPRWRHVFTMQIPAYVTMILICISSSVFWIVGKSGQKTTTSLTEKNQGDTLYLATKPDTVIIEKVVYRYRKTKAFTPAPYAVVKRASINPKPSDEGVNMKEKEELERLLVSGS